MVSVEAKTMQSPVWRDQTLLDVHSSCPLPVRMAQPFRSSATVSGFHEGRLMPRLVYRGHGSFEPGS